MSDYSPEQAEKDLGETTAILRGWYANRESDSVSIQNMRYRQYWVGVRLMRQLMYGVMPDRQLQLKIGETAVDTAQRRILAPGSELAIKKEDIRQRFEIFTPSWAYTEELFLGEGPRRVPMSEMARTLIEGGELAIVEVPVSAEAPARA